MSPLLSWTGCRRALVSGLGGGLVCQRPHHLHEVLLLLLEEGGVARVDSERGRERARVCLRKPGEGRDGGRDGSSVARQDVSDDQCRCGWAAFDEPEEWAEIVGGRKAGDVEACEVCLEGLIQHGKSVCQVELLHEPR